MAEAQVLVVDEDGADMVRELRDVGVRALHVRTVTELLRLVSKKRYDLVVCDRDLPEMQELRLLRELRHRTDVVLMSNEVDNAAAVRAHLAGVHFMIRPVAAAALVDVVAALHAFTTPPTIVASLTATQAKNQFAVALEKAEHEGPVAINKHKVRRAVLVAADTFDALVKRRDDELTRLSAEFDEMLEDMQTPSAREGLREAFAASSREQGRAAVAVANDDG